MPQRKMNPGKAKAVENLTPDIYRCKYPQKSKKFRPGDIVKLIKIPGGRGWISEHAKLGMAGIVVDYGPGVYDYAVYWSEADYKGEPINKYKINRWQMFFEDKDENAKN
jgi:hypothetical protein